MPNMLAQLATDINRAEALETRLQATRNLAIKHGVPHHYLLLVSDAISHSNTAIHNLKLFQLRLQHAVATANL